MSIQPAPTSNANVFNSSFYSNSNSTYLTETVANTLYLQLQNGGTVLSNTIINANLTVSGNISVSGAVSNLTIANALFEANIIETATSYTGTWSQVNSAYVVSTPFHLLQIMSNSTSWTSAPANPWAANYIQTANLDLTGQSGSISTIGNVTTAFTGNYNGNGYWINNFTINTQSANCVGLFGNVSNSNISNITMTGSSMNVKGNNFTGALIGQVNGGATNISNIVIQGYGNINDNNSTCVGGVIGYVANANSISNIVSYLVGYVGNTYPSGGIIGNLGQCVNTISNLCNFMTGNVIGGGDDTGGIIGLCHATLATPTLQNCINGMTGSMGNCVIGGIVGRNNAVISLTDCINCMIGNISSTSGAPQAGGIIGASQAQANLQNCHNFMQGNITSSVNSSSLGGLLGSISGPHTCANCIVAMNGNMSLTGTGGTIGGITSSGGSYTISQCLVCMSGNITSVSGNNGGLVGNLTGTLMGGNNIVSGNCNIAGTNSNIYYCGTGGTDTSTNNGYRTTYGLLIGGTPPTANTSNVSSTIPANASTPFIYYQTTAQLYSDFPMMWTSNSSTNMSIIYFAANGNSSYTTTSQVILTQNPLAIPIYCPTISNVNGIQWIQDIGGIYYSNGLNAVAYYANNNSNSCYLSTSLNSFTFANTVNINAPLQVLSASTSNIGNLSIAQTSSYFWLTNANLVASGVANNFALTQTNTGTTYLNCSPTQTIQIQCNNVTVGNISSGGYAITGNCNVSAVANVVGNIVCGANALITGYANCSSVNTTANVIAGNALYFPYQFCSNPQTTSGGTSGAHTSLFLAGIPNSSMWYLTASDSSHVYFTLGSPLGTGAVGAIIYVYNASTQTLQISPGSGAAYINNSSSAISLTSYILYTFICYYYDGSTYTYWAAS